MVFKIYNFFAFKIQYYFLTGLNYIIPKSKKQIFLFDKRFRKDNVWVIAEYLSKNKKYNGYKIYYYTKKNLAPKNNIVFISNGLHALWSQLRANYIFFSYTDIKVFKPVRNQKIINTMHGSPLKNIGYLTGNSKFKKLWNFESTFSHILCVSNFFKNIIKQSFGAGDEQCIVLGYPRNDLIFSNLDALKRLEIRKESFNKIVLWLPTWRGTSMSGENNESNIDFPILRLNNINFLNKILLNLNILLIIKPHPNQLDLEILNQKYSNIETFKNQDLEKNNVNLYQMFNQVDALLTDYSSVYFDFLLTMKPIGFTIDDFDSYNNKRGFVVDNPLEIMPGAKITNMDELIFFMKDLKEEKDLYSEERKKINDIANKYKDGNSTKRILEHLGL